MFEPYKVTGPILRWTSTKDGADTATVGYRGIVVGLSGPIDAFPVVHV